MRRRPGQVALPEESRDNISSHDFWKWGTSTIFDIRIVGINAVYYLCMMPEKSPTKVENDKNNL